MFFDLPCLCPTDQDSPLHLNELDHIFHEETGRIEEWVPCCACWLTEDRRSRGRREGVKLPNAAAVCDIGTDSTEGTSTHGWSKFCSLFTLQWWKRKVSFYTPWLIGWHIWFIYMYLKSSISLWLRLPLISSLLKSRLLNSIHAHFLSFQRSISGCRGCC